MAPTYRWTCRRCQASNDAGSDVCSACMFPALGGARAAGQADATTTLPPAASPRDGLGWIRQEAALLFPQVILAGVVLLASPLWFVVLLRNGQYAASAVLFIGIAPAMLLVAVAFRQKSAGGLYLGSWVTFVAIVIAGLVARLTQ
ncbi:MAG: hypothetical protein ACJ8GJ_01205 [Vitreoscilla sp.]